MPDCNAPRSCLLKRDGFLRFSCEAERNRFEILPERLLLHVFEIEARGFEYCRCDVARDPALNGNRRCALVRPHNVELLSGPRAADDFPWVAGKLGLVDNE